MRFFEKGDDVIVKDPTDESCLYEHGFAGSVVGFRGDDIVVVEDQDEDCWDVDRIDIEFDLSEKECIIVTDDMIVGVLEALVSTAQLTTSLQNIYNDNTHHSEPNHSYSWVEVNKTVEHIIQKTKERRSELQNIEEVS